MTPIPNTNERLLRLPAVIEITGLSRTSIYRGITAMGFPKPVKLGRVSAWPASEVHHWVEVCKAERNSR